MLPGQQDTIKVSFQDCLRKSGTVSKYDPGEGLNSAYLHFHPLTHTPNTHTLPTHTRSPHTHNLKAECTETATVMHHHNYDRGGVSCRPQNEPMFEHQQGSQGQTHILQKYYHCGAFYLVSMIIATSPRPWMTTCLVAWYNLGSFPVMLIQHFVRASPAR